ncbi:MAG TPA: M23 family metallopeptidase [Acidimicrobiales bacterium]|nr:M23 family metallopeptidase [Acidimicrobiales bacterium]
MLGVRNRVVRRWAAAVTVVALAVAPTATAGASPGPAGQAPPGPDDSSSSDELLVNVDVLVSTNAAAVASTLEELGTQIAEQLETYNTAQAAVSEANDKLADADSALSETEFLIEETTIESDEVVIQAFINPPNERALDVLAAETPADATVKQALLDMDADRSASSLTDLQDALASYESLKEAQLEALNEAETARAEAEAALADLESSLSTQAQFVTQVQAALDGQAGEAATDPDALARQAEIATALEDAAEAAALAEAARIAEEARRRRIEAGIMFCPVDGPVDFIDSWGFARSGGRTHKGVDMMASTGTPTVAPVSGEVVHRGSSLGGLSWYVYGDNGNTYYGTHLSGYANQGVGWVEAGTLIGYVGDSGNAAGTPHLHFEIHPGGGSPVNPYPATAEACFG